MSMTLKEISAKRIWANSANAVQLTVEDEQCNMINVFVCDYESKIYEVSKKDVLSYMANGENEDDYDPEYIECYYALTKEAKASKYYEFFMMGKNILKNFK